jgi:phage terminase small subunit
MGMSFRDAYKSAGYTGPFPYGKQAASNSIVHTPEFKHYLFYLREKTAERTHQSVELLIKQLDDARLLAMVDHQVPAAIQAIMSKAKLLGYLVDKSEIELHILNKPSREPIDVTDLSVEEWQERFAPQRQLEQLNNPFDD